MRGLLLRVAMCAVLVLSMNVQGWTRPSPIWVIDPGKSYGPYFLGMSLREVGTILKWSEARIAEAENGASSANLIVTGGAPSLYFESTTLTRISVSVRSARTPSGVGVGSTLADVVRVFGGDPQIEFRSGLITRKPGQRCLVANVFYDAGNAKVYLSVEYRNRGIEFLLDTATQRPLLVSTVHVFVPQACK